MNESFSQRIINPHPIDSSRALSSNKIEQLFGPHYLYKGRVIDDVDMFDLLNKTRDKTIMDLAHQSLKADNISKVGYITIPAFIGTLVFGEYSISKVYKSNGTTDMRKKNTYQAGAVVFIITTIACPTINIYMKSKYKKTRKEALKLYNEKY